MPLATRPGSYWIDRGNPITKGLSALFQAGSIDPISQTAFGSDGGYAFGSNQSGRCAVFDGSSTGITLAATALSSTGPFTLFAVAKTYTTSGTRNICSIGSGGSYAVQLRQDGANWSFYRSGTGDVLSGESGGVTANVMVVICATYDGAGNTTLYHNGIAVGSNFDGAATRTVTSLHIGEDNYGAKQAWQGEINLLAFYNNRGFTAAEVRSLSDRPAQLFAATRRTFSAGAAPIYQRALYLA